MMYHAVQTVRAITTQIFASYLSPLFSSEVLRLPDRDWRQSPILETETET